MEERDLKQHVSAEVGELRDTLMDHYEAMDRSARNRALIITGFVVFALAAIVLHAAGVV